MSDDKTHYEEKKPTVVTPENIQRVENLFTSEANASVKRGSQVLEISDTLLNFKGKAIDICVENPSEPSIK